MKVCGRCGEARGLNVVEGLEVVFDAQSGAVEDLVGVFTQLAAASWVARERSVPIAFAVLDEPGAHLDEALKKALAMKLPRMLASLSIGQAFVVAHSPAAVDALPGRLSIVSDGKFSKVSVER